MYRIESLQDTAGLNYPEDGIVIANSTDKHQLYIVNDSYSSPYNGNPSLTKGFTTGQTVTQIITKNFRRALNSPYSSGHLLEKTLKNANRETWVVVNKKIYENQGLGYCAGASLVCAEILDKHLHLIQGGDCLAIWHDLDGVHITPNLFYPFDKETEEILKSDEDPKESRKRELKLLVELRKTKANKKEGYSIFNGDKKVKYFWFSKEIPLQGLRYLLMFSDGLVPFTSMKDLNSLSLDIDALLRGNGTLSTILDWTIRIQKERREASAILIRF